MGTQATLLLVHAPWCHFCRELMPEWRRLVDELEARASPVCTRQLELEELHAERRRDPQTWRVIEADGRRAITAVPHIVLLITHEDASLPPAAVHYDDTLVAADYEGAPHEGPRTALHIARFLHDQVVDNASPPRRGRAA